MNPLRCASLGSGPDLLLVHGWGIGRTAWQPVAGALAQSFRVHLIELPGYGDAPPSADGFAETAEQLAASLPAGVILCGWSLGGLLAQRAAHLAPARIGRLILVSSTPCFTQRGDWPEAQPPELLAAFAAALAGDAAAVRQRFIALINQGDRAARACTRTLAQLAGTSLPERATLARGLAWLRDTDLRAETPAIGTPTLLIHGGGDALIAPAAAHWLHARLPASRLEIIAGAAHAPFISDPARFVQLIEETRDARAA